jgi:hypothetical protein
MEASWGRASAGDMNARAAGASVFVLTEGVRQSAFLTGCPHLDPYLRTKLIRLEYAEGIAISVAMRE